MSVRVDVPDGEWVNLSDSVTVPMGAAAYAALEGAPATSAAIVGILASVYIAPAPYGGIEGWSFSEDGQPVPLTAANIARLLTWSGGGKEVAEKANELYSEELFRPLVSRLSKPSPDGPTEPISLNAHSGRAKSAGKGSKRSSLTVTDGRTSEASAR